MELYSAGQAFSVTQNSISNWKAENEHLANVRKHNQQFIMISSITK